MFPGSDATLAVERIFYAPQLRRLHRLFGNGRCLIMLNEDIRYDLASALAKCWEFLGCSSACAPDPVSKIVRPLDSDPALPTIEPVDREYLQEMYRADVAETSQLIGRDLSH